MTSFVLMLSPRGLKLAYFYRYLLASGLLSVLTGIIFMFAGELLVWVSSAGVDLIVSLSAYVLVHMIALARHKTTEINAPDNQLLEGCQKEAREAPKGLWEDDDPMPPREWRRR